MRITPSIRFSLMLSWLAAVAVGLLCVSLGVDAEAAPRKKRAAPEVYSAEDPDASPADEAALLGLDSPEISSDLGNAWAEVESPEEAPPPPPEPDQIETPPVASKSAEKSPSAAGRKAPPGWGLYEEVPTQHRKALAERLRLVETLIRKHGRAYDYRVHTTPQLKKALRLLEENTP